MKYYQNKVVFITGGASGLGKEMARQIVISGAKAVALLDLAKTEAAVTELTSLAQQPQHTTVQGFVLNTTDLASTKTGFAQAETALGTPDIIIHCAGVGRTGLLAEQAQQEFELVNTVNIFGTRNIAEVAYPLLLKSQGQLLIIASMAGIVANYAYGAYGASKFATLGMAEVLRYEWKPKGIRVSVACPPEVPTPLVEAEHKTAPALTIKLKYLAGKVELEPACRYILKKLAKQQFKIVPGLKAKAVMLSQSTMPWLNRKIVDTIIARNSEK